MKQDQRYFELLDAAGQKPTKVNDMVVSVRDRLTQVIDNLGVAMQKMRGADRDVVAAARAELDEIRTAVLEGGQHNSDLGTALEALAKWGSGDDSQPAPSPGAPGTTGLKPGQRIADAGEQSEYRGTINPYTLTRENWAYYQQRNLGARASEIFDRPPVIGNLVIGPDHRYTQGDLATATPDAGPLAAFG